MTIDELLDPLWEQMLTQSEIDEIIELLDRVQEAHEKMLADDCQVLYVTGAHGAAKQRVFGIVTREHIDNSYRL